MNIEYTCITRVDEEFIDLIGHSLAQATPTCPHFAGIANLRLPDDYFEW